MTVSSSTGHGPATRRLVELCDEALGRLGNGSPRAGVEEVRGRLVEPLRVAVAGLAKAGKSTLVNALIGRPVAPTAVGECTRVATWFAYDFPERAELRLRSGEVRPLPLRPDGTLPADLGVEPRQVDSVRAWLSAAPLRDRVLIDTPGLASLDRAVSDTTRELLATTSRRAAGEADALVYVMTQGVRGEDASTLAAFRASGGADRGCALGAVGVLNKADKVGDGRDPSLSEARQLADRYAHELRGDVTTVLPAIGLLAETATVALREADVAHLRRLAALDPRTRARMLRSADAVTHADVPVPPAARARLLELLDLFGLACCLEWIDGGAAGAAELVERLRVVSGIAPLERQLEQVLWERSDVLKADRALRRLEQVAYTRDEPDVSDALGWLRDELDSVRLEPVMHSLDEAWALQRVASGAVTLPAELEHELRELALRATPDPGGTAADQDREWAMRGADRWQAFINAGGTSPDQASVGTVVRRSYLNRFRRASARTARS